MPRFSLLTLCAISGAIVCTALPQQRDFIFEENRGQAEKDVEFIGRGEGAALHFAADGVGFPGPISLRFAGHAAKGGHWEPLEPLASTSSFFIGNDATQWIRGARHYKRLIHRGIYPGIDVVFYAKGGRLEYDFVLSPHADPALIRLAWSGAELPKVTATGALALGSRLICRQPVVYQLTAQGRVEVPARFLTDAKSGETKLDVGDYDATLPLTIDPVLDFLTFLGGAGNDRVTAVGGIFVAGVTDTVRLPGPATDHHHIFVWDGSSYTVFGGAGDEEPTSIIATSFSYVVAGWTTSRNFPMLGSQAIQSVFGGGNTDGFIITNQYGNLTSTYFGGSGDDRILAMSGNGLMPSDLYLAGETTSTDFPAITTIQPASAGGKDGFLAHINATGALVESTYFGGSGDDAILAVDCNPTVCWIGGRTASTDLALVAPLQKTLAGKTDAFLTRINVTAAAVVEFSSYYGGSGDDEIRGVRVAADGWAWTGGYTTSTDLPLAAPSQGSLGGDADVWLGRFHPTTNAPSFVTYFGGSAHDELTAIAQDFNGELVVAGFTNSTDLRTLDALQDVPGGSDDGFLARFDRNGNPVMSTYLGGSGNDRFRALSIGDDLTITVGGESDSTDLPTLSKANKTATLNAGQLDGIVLQFHNDGVYGQDIVLGKNLSVKLDVRLSGADASLTTAMVVSNNPALVTVNGSAFATLSSPYPISVTGLASTGETDLVVSALGLPPRLIHVTLQPSYLITSYSAPLSVPYNTSLMQKLVFGIVDPVTGATAPQGLTIDPQVSLQSSNTNVVQTSISNGSAQLTAVGMGSASVAITSPLFPIQGPKSWDVRVAQRAASVLVLHDQAVGQLLESAMPIELPSAGTPVSIRFTSEDPSKLTLSVAPGDKGTPSATYQFVPADFTHQIWLHGLAASGMVRVRAEVDGMDPIFVNVALAHSVFTVAPGFLVPFSNNPYRYVRGVTTAAVDLWTTATRGNLTAGISDRVAAGFAVRDQSPSPEANSNFTVTSTNPNVIQANFSLSFGFGLPYSFFSVVFLNPGTTSLVVASTDFDTIPLDVTVRPGDLPLSISEMTLGKDLTGTVYWDSTFDFPPNVTVTLTSADPKRLLVGANQLGSDQPSVKVSMDRSQAFFVTALDSSGDVTVSAEAAGFGTRKLIVHLAPLTFQLIRTKPSYVIDDYPNVGVHWTYPKSALATSGNTQVRTGVDLTFTATSSDPSVVRIERSLVTLSYGTGLVNCTALSEGTATISVKPASAAVVDAVPSSVDVTVTRRPMSFGPTQTFFVGKDLQRPLPLPSGAYLGKPLLRSLDPSRVLLTIDPGAPGKESVNLTGPVYVQALADSGDVTIIASLDGYMDATLTVKLVPSGLAFFNNLQVTTPYIITASIGASIPLRIAPVMVDPWSGNPIMVSDVAFRAGLDAFSVTLRSSNPAIGRVLSPVAFLGSLRENTTQFRADTLGTTDISIETPDGFASAGPAATRRIQVKTPSLVMPNLTVGKDMMVYAGVSSTAGLSVPFTITSSDPALVLLSAGQVEPAVQSLTQTNASFYVHGLAAQGTASLTITAAGFDPIVATVRLEPSYFAFVGKPVGSPIGTDALAHSNFSHQFTFSSASTSGYDDARLRSGIPSLAIPFTTSDTSVVLPLDATFPGDYSFANANFTANSPGTATVQVGAPAGFTLAPDALRTLSVTVR